MVSIRFYEELNDFLAPKNQKIQVNYFFKINQTVKDAVEALGVPHVEVDLILVNGKSVTFDYHLQTGDQISVYPVFETFDIAGLTRLRPQPLRETKFVLDVHLGKLCKYLRMLGFDTFYRNNLDDDEIVQISKSEKRIILTRDIGILKTGMVTHGYWIRSKNSKEQIQEVIGHFNLQTQIQPFYRCTVCNGIVAKVNKGQVEHLLQINTKKFFDNFYQCSACQKVYWEGSHYENMHSFIDKLKLE